MRKLFILGVIAILVSSVLVACSGGDDGGPEAKPVGTADSDRSKDGAGGAMTPTRGVDD